MLRISVAMDPYSILYVVNILINVEHFIAFYINGQYCYSLKSSQLLITYLRILARWLRIQK
jgi:hypothetical protein